MGLRGALTAQERILSHLGEKGESRKGEVISELTSESLEPRLEVLALL
jgi:hypothetical protein